jgi:hypothetical protein
MDKFRFLDATGRVCCQTNNPALLCRTCRAQLRPEGVPPPPGLADAIQQARAAARPLGRHARAPQQALTVVERHARAGKILMDTPRPMSTVRMP